MKKDRIDFLFSALCTTYTEIIDEEISKDINPRMSKILVHIMNNEGCNHSDLAQKYKISKSNVTKIIDSFVSKGFVERRFSEKDRRVIYIHITEKGKQVCERMDNIIMEHANIMTAFLNEEEKKQLEPKLVAMINALYIKADKPMMLK